MGGRKIVFDNWSLGGNGLELGGGFLHFIYTSRCYRKTRFYGFHAL